MSEQSLTDSESEYSSDDSFSSVEEYSDNEKHVDSVEESNTCCICLDEVSDDSGYKLDQCGHLFHTDCIVRNIQQGNIHLKYYQY